MFIPGDISHIIECVRTMRRAQRDLEQSRARLAASHRVLGKSLERLCETDRRLQESAETAVRDHPSVEA